MRIVEDIKRQGQPFVHEPVYEEISRGSRVAIHIENIAMCPVHVFGAQPKQPERPSDGCLMQRLYTKGLLREQIGHERVRLRWMKPDGRGGLVEA